ncbi:SDR family oxidoreductase [Thermosulfuriphilus sp.]
MARFLVTGGAGFIGSNITERLLKDGHYVRVLDDFSNGKEENLDFSAPLKERLEVIRGDIRDPSVCKEACQAVEYIFHEAALGSVPRSIDDPQSTNEINITGTLNLLWAAKEAGVKRFVYAASSSAYGDKEDPFGQIIAKKETMAPNPLSPYAVSKLTGEYYCQVFSQVYGLETVILRYFNVFGPRQDPHSMYAAVVPKFITSLLKGQSPTIFGDGEQSRDFTYIDNVVEANLKACFAGKEAVGEVFNIACGRRTSINELYRLIAQLIGTDLKPHYAPARAGDVRHSLADISKAQKILGLQEMVSLEEGLRKTIDWYRKGLEE